MTKTFYFTGDRALDPLTAVQVVAGALSIITLENKGVPFRIVTGDAPTGIERAIRYLVPAQACKVFEREKNAEGKIDFDTQHTLIKDDVDAVIFLHSDPLGSTVGKSVAKIFDFDKIRYLMQEQKPSKNPDVAEVADLAETAPAPEAEPEQKPES
jgi:hypothetical protein